MEFPQEIVYKISLPDVETFNVLDKIPFDYFCYEIITIKDCPFGSTLKYIVIKDFATLKMNAYGTLDEFIPYNLVKNYTPLILQAAKIIFPEMYFNEKNYGFVKCVVPGDF